MSFRFRLEPAPGQVAGLLDRCAEARQIWNLGVQQQECAMRYRPYRIGKRQNWPSALEREAQLKEARSEFAWLQAGFVSPGPITKSPHANRPG